MIEGDEGEVVLQDETPKGETLLIKEYLLEVGAEMNSLTTPSPMEVSELALDTSIKVTQGRELAVNGWLTVPRPVSSSAIHAGPEFRPVTPQSYRSKSSMEANTPGMHEHIHKCGNHHAC